MTGTLVGMSGSASIPTYAFAGATTSGLYSLGNGDIGLSLNGVQAATFTAASGLTINGALGASGSAAIGGALAVGGSLAVLGSLVCNGVNAQAGTTYTIAATDFIVFLSNTGTVAVTLPSAVSSNGRLLLLAIGYSSGSIINSASSNILRVDGTTSNHILNSSGSLGDSITPGVWVLLASNGSQWQVVAGF